MIDYDRDGWPDILVANDTQPNKLYRNLRNGTFEEVGGSPGIAFSEDGKARAGMGIDAADFENSGVAGMAITNFDNEMMALIPGRAQPDRSRISRWPPASGRRPATASASAALSSMPIWTAGSIWSWPTGTSTRQSATSAETSDTHSRRTYSSITAAARFHDVAREAGSGVRRCQKWPVAWPMEISITMATSTF